MSIWHIYIYSHTTMKTTQLARTLTNLCTAYLNTNYISVEDIVDVFDYEQDEKILERFRKVMEPVREKWFEDYIDKWEWTEDDLEDMAWELAMKLKRLNYKLQDEEKIENAWIEIWNKIINEWKQSLTGKDKLDYVWDEAFKLEMHDSFWEIMLVVDRVINNWYCMQ